MFLLIDQLSESQLFPSRKSLGKYEPQEISELAYLHIIALNILLSEEYSHVWATNYAKKTTRSTNFKKWRNDATDLYVMMHALTDDSENLGDDSDADYYRDGIGIYPTMIFNWISRAGMNNEKEADTKRLFSKMDQMFRIRNGSMRAVRRLVQDWDDLSLHDKKLAMTRLLQFMRSRCPKSDLLAQLTKLSASNKLELHGVNNPEALEGPRKPKGSFLLSLGAGVAGGLIGAALVRKMKHESASGGGTGASCVAAVPGNGASAAGTIGAGFDLDYSKSVYPSPAPKKEKKKAVLSRLTEGTDDHPDIMYHQSGHIDSIIKHGLKREYDQTCDEFGVKGIYLSTKPSEGCLAVNVKGLDLEEDETRHFCDLEDENEQWWVCYDCDIPPSRITKT